MRIVCVSYRNWALKIYDTIVQNTDHTILIIRSTNQYHEQAIKDFKPDLILYYGWSWIVSDEMINTYKCIMLHPSPLPKYRGGSPIQNQIINNEKESAVTLFLMDTGMDSGDIICQKKFSLEGHLVEIFERITTIGIDLTQKLLDGDYTLIKQQEKNKTVFKRRTPQDSEITLDELQTKTGEYLFNKIRMLEDPYPNAFYKTIDKKKLLIKLAEISD
ncbi:formyltransferase family protein [Desulfobacula sp.]|uniref:formyltransferase family protein n=1 Tax=Desulfobacula sp. TaxID=2593537 RepID=UPI002607948A|nr:formyltransferase family protein [Desulfobacula sp.]